jgi:hypothetical protein
MNEIIVQPIGVVRNERTGVEDDDWGDVVSTIVIDDELPAEALEGIAAFSHVEIIFYFHRVEPARIVAGARRPRNNPAWSESLPSVARTGRTVSVFPSPASLRSMGALWSSWVWTLLMERRF